MLKNLFILILLSTQISIYAADETRPISITYAWAQKLFSNPEIFGLDNSFSLNPLPKSAYRFEAGVYESIVSRLKLKIPRIADERTVSVREAVVFNWADGQVGTSHVIFVPDVRAPNYDNNLGVSAVVVTRLRDDRSKARDAVLARFEPASIEARERLAKSGVNYSRVDSEFGDSTRRLTINRIFEEPFPYQTKQSRGSEVRSVGVSRFLVVQEDSLLELSQIVPCSAFSADECVQNAIKVNDSFVNGLMNFLVYPKSTAN